MKTYGLRVNIYKSDYECSLNLCYGFKTVFVPCERGNVCYEEDCPELPFVEIKKGNLPGTVMAVAKDCEERSGSISFGGSYVGCSDSRFSEEVEKVLGARFYGAVALHDRFETWEECDLYSR